MLALVLAAVLSVQVAAPASCRETPGLRILIAYAEPAPGPLHLRRRLLDQRGVMRVDLFDAGRGTPSLARLRRFDEVVAFSDSPVANGRAFGDNLAEYELGGGVVVTSAFATYDNPAYGIGGRWRSDGLAPLSYTTTIDTSRRALGPVLSSHPLMRGVRRLVGPLAMQVDAAAGAVPVAAWDDGLLAVAVKGRAVGVNAYIGNGFSSGRGDFARLLVNAGRLTPSCRPASAPAA